MTLYYEDFDYDISREYLVEVLAECIYRRGLYGELLGGKKKLDILTIKTMIKEFDLDDDNTIDAYIDEIKDYVYEDMNLGNRED